MSEIYRNMITRIRYALHDRRAFDRMTLDTQRLLRRIAHGPL